MKNNVRISSKPKKRKLFFLLVDSDVVIKGEMEGKGQLVESRDLEGGGGGGRGRGNEKMDLQSVKNLF